ncbi:MAG TPA: Hpt domain-containing protein [Steroidobacter sp.]|uniref:Hpt domain-containing protein n=1 Tax=Steroidobacter sp. TaxID=1978227 RepID=UPI002EDA8CE1
MSRSKDRPQSTGGPNIETHEVLDVDVLHDLLASLAQPAAVAAVYRKFVANAEDFIESLATQQGAAFGDTLHTLKGSAAMLGARCLAQRAACLQAQSESSVVQVEQAIEQLTTELTKFREALASQLSALGESPDP